VTEQLSLFGPPDPGRRMVGRHHAVGPETERIAAGLVMPRSGTQRKAVLDRLRVVGEFGATDRRFADRRIRAG